MHSIEALLDDESDEAVRATWLALRDAGLPSQARHAGESNAPHVTLVARPVVDASTDETLARAAASLPVPIGFAGLVVFGRPPRGLVLARLVTSSVAILGLHDLVHRISSDGDDTESPHTRVGAWTPHVTLASRLTPEQLAGAIELVSGLPDVDRRGTPTLARLRRWDPTEKRIVPLGSADYRSPPDSSESAGSETA